MLSFFIIFTTIKEVNLRKIEEKRDKLKIWHLLHDLKKIEDLIIK